MLNYLLTRLLTAAIVVVGVSSMVFLLIHLVPGDPVEVMLGESAQAADREALRHALGLDQPLITQWLDFLLGIAHLDLGNSLHSKQAVVDILFERVPATLELALAALAVALFIAFPLGVLAATRKNTAVDHSAMVVSMLGVSIPNFVMGPLLIIVFSVQLGWLPVSGRDTPTALVLPALTLGTALAAVLSRMLRTSLLEVLDEDYIRTARAKGLTSVAVIWRHAFRNALLPVTTLLGLQLGALLAGAVITEVVFSWPGVGQLTVEAIQRRDYPLLQGCILLVSFTYVLVNTATDIVYALIDPRIKIGTA
ncbi:nickel ABC transporter permease [Kaarinaea lacus]